jgi:CHAD domain-containing protein
MNDIASGHILLTNGLRQLIATIRAARQRLLVSEAARIAGTTTDDEAVHDFRVALRRSRTLLRVARILWSSKQIVRIERELRYYARTTGTLRDDEVLRNTLVSLPPPETTADEVNAWLAKRAARGRGKHYVILRIVRDGPSRKEAASEKGKRIRPLDTVLDKLDRLLDKPTKACAVHELAQVSIETALRDVRRGAQSDAHDARAMHSLRIREKRLRYTVELFANELGEEGRRLLTHATRMQRRLGELHDFDEAMATVSRARGLKKATQRAIVEALRIARATSAVKVAPHLIEARELELPLVLSCNESLPKSST